MKKLGRSQIKNLKGGFEEGGSGSCTYSYEGVNCTSQGGNCQNLYCCGGGAPGRQFGVCCDNTKYPIAGGASDCAELGGYLNCAA